MKGGDVSSVLLLGYHDIYNLEATTAPAASCPAHGASCPTQESTGMATHKKKLQLQPEEKWSGATVTAVCHSGPDLDRPQQTSTELSLTDAGVCVQTHSD